MIDVVLLSLKKMGNWEGTAPHRTHPSSARSFWGCCR
jgi:hypothetical protein